MMRFGVVSRAFDGCLAAMSIKSDEVATGIIKTLEQLCIPVFIGLAVYYYPWLLVLLIPASLCWVALMAVRVHWDARRDAEAYEQRKRNAVGHAQNAIERLLTPPPTKRRG